MKFLHCMVMALIALNASAAYGNSDEFRGAYARSVKDQLQPPVNYGQVTLTDVFHAKETKALCYTYIGKPDRNAVAKAASGMWSGSGGAEMRKYGFKDAIYAYGSGNNEYGLYSCSERKWYSGITAYAKAKGLYHGR